MTDQPDGDDGKKRVRSPAYPYISLPKAIELARTFWGKERHHPARASAAVEHFGFSAKSGPGVQTLAALIHFGLLEGAGAKEARTVKLTPLAMRILQDSDPISPPRLEAIRQAAVKPTLYSDLLSKYGAASLPSDRTLRDYLLFDRKFNADVVDLVIREFRETVSFANLDGHATLRPVDTPDTADEQTVGESGQESSMEATPQQQQKPIQPPPPAPSKVTIAPGAVQRAFTTGNDTMDATITITSHSGEITGDDIAFLKDYLEFLGKGWSRRKPESAPPRVAPEPASRLSEQTRSELLDIGCSRDEINGMTEQDAKNKITMATRKG